MVENENPRPIISVEEWSRNDTRWHNTQERGSELDEQGYEQNSVKHRYYTLRVDFSIRANREHEAYNALNDFEDLVLTTNPREIHDHIRRLSWGGSSGVDPHHEVERSEASVACHIFVRSYRQWKKEESPLKNIEYEWHYDYQSNSE